MAPRARNAAQQLPVRLAYLVSHPIQYQAPLLRRIAAEPDIQLTVFFGSDFSVRGYRDEGFGVEVAWDVPLLDGYASEFLPALRDNGTVTATSPINYGIYPRLQAGAFDALWVHGYASVNAFHAILAANALGIPVLLRAEGWLGDRERSAWKLALKRIFFSVLRPAVATVLPIGTLNARYWSEYLPEVPQFSMPYAVDSAWFGARAAQAQPRIPALRNALGLDAGRPVILFASKLQTRKHCDHLVSAYAAFRQGRAAEAMPYLVIVGDGEERGHLQQQATALGLDDVHFAGFRNQSELPAFFALADVFVLPSRHEPWGLIVNEAMACGCAVIVSSDVGSHADLVTDGVEGCVFPVGDIEALVRSLERVFATPSTPVSMGEAARRRIAHWSIDEDVQGLREALQYTTRRLRA